MVGWTYSLGTVEVSKHCEEGAEKYGEHNVDKGIPLHSLCDSAARHLAKFIAGEIDEDHLRAACWNLLWALNQRKTHPELDDLYSHKEIRNAIEEVTSERDVPRPLTFAELVIRHGQLVFAEEYIGTNKFYEGLVTVNVCFEKNEIHLCPDLSKPDEWFFYDEGFVKCYDVDPSTGKKDG